MTLGVGFWGSTQHDVWGRPIHWDLLPTGWALHKMECPPTRLLGLLPIWQGIHIMERPPLSSLVITLIVLWGLQAEGLQSSSLSHTFTHNTTPISLLISSSVSFTGEFLSNFDLKKFISTYIQRIFHGEKNPNSPVAGIFFGIGRFLW
jgi:hypothetical protein